MKTVKSILPVQHPAGWRVRVRMQDGATLYHGTGSGWTMHQAQVAADSLRRDIRNHDADALTTLEWAA